MTQADLHPSDFVGMRYAAREATPMLRSLGLRTTMVAGFTGVLVACTPTQIVPTVTEDRIVRVTVVEDRPDELVLEVEYERVSPDYPGRVQAITRFDGESTGYWAYHSAPIELGRHVANERIGMHEAPAIYVSNELEVRLERRSVQKADHLDHLRPGSTGAA